MPGAGAADAGANMQASPTAPTRTMPQGTATPATPAMNSTRPMTNADGSMNSNGSMTGTGAMGNVNSGMAGERVAQADRN